MIRGTYRQESWWSRRWYKDHFWQKERMAKHEEIRREAAELPKTKYLRVICGERSEESSPQYWFQELRGDETSYELILIIEAIIHKWADVKAEFIEGPVHATWGDRILPARPKTDV